MFKPGAPNQQVRANSMATGTNILIPNNKPQGGKTADSELLMQSTMKAISKEQRIEEQKDLQEFSNFLNNRETDDKCKNMDQIVINIQKGNKYREEKEKKKQLVKPVSTSSTSTQSSIFFKQGSNLNTSQQHSDSDNIMNFLQTDSDSSQEQSCNSNHPSNHYIQKINKCTNEQEKRKILEGMRNNNEIFKGTLDKVFEQYISYSQNSQNKEYLTGALQNLLHAFDEMEREESGGSKKVLSEVYKSIYASQQMQLQNQRNQINNNNSNFNNNQNNNNNHSHNHTHNHNHNH